MTPSNERELSGRVAVVTGSSSGIGRAIALGLATAGADVLVHAGKNLAGAKETSSGVRGFGQQSQVLVADFLDDNAIEPFAESAWNWRGRVDIWVNNAGAEILIGQAAKASFEEKLRRLWQIDVVATIRLSRLIGAKLQERGQGTIINVGWDQGETGMAGDTGELFAATKGAVMSFTRSVAKSLAPQVRVNCVAPGWIKTAWGEGASAKWQERAERESLLARWGTPQDVAQMVGFLASPAAGFINGQVLTVNGGRTD